MKRLFLAIALVACTATAHAEFVSSPTLAGWLDSAASTTGSFKDTTIVTGYVAAISDVLAGTEVCAPANLRQRRMLMAVRGWMRRHSGTWDDNAALTVRRALIELYPCPPNPDR
ncbi:MAG: Rap1a/Tai family immunity protein [Betaproteobacteria bacterium]